MGAGAVQAALARLEARDLSDAVRDAGASLNDATGEVSIDFLGAVYRLAGPGLDFTEDSPRVPEHVRALLIYYLGTTDGVLPTGRTISFAELPDGGFYVQAFRGYSAAAIERAFGEDGRALQRAVETLGGVAIEGPADLSWRIPALPRVPVTLSWWSGDDEFGPRVELLFDETASRHLPTDGCAVLGSWLTAMLKAAQASVEDRG